jgi:23S rRNA (cytosine1962-C5)-methyltransferase
MNMKAITLKKSEEKRIKAGHLWIYSNEIDTKLTPLKTFEAGELIEIMDSSNKSLGLGYINPQSLLSVRMLSRKVCKIDLKFFKKRIKNALSLREDNFEAPYYRLVFGEGDFLPGLVIDRFGEHFVIQIATQGMEQFKAIIVQAIDDLFQPESILIKNDSNARKLEGLEAYVEQVVGDTPSSITVIENGAKFLCPVKEGQKTGWFYDHRDNRKRIQKIASNKRILDVFSYVGAFGIEAGIAGANEIYCVDASSLALDYVEQNAQANGFAEKVTCIEGNAFDALKELATTKEKFDIVIIDPPAFIKRKKDIKAGIAGYRRINELGIRLTEKGGYFIAASCSMHMAEEELISQCQQAARQNDRTLQLIEKGEQSCDHPVHPMIPETRYIKSLMFRVLEAQ